MGRVKRCPLYPLKRTSAQHIVMSALCHSRHDPYHLHVLRNWPLKFCLTVRSFAATRLSTDSIAQCWNFNLENLFTSVISRLARVTWGLEVRWVIGEFHTRPKLLSRLPLRQLHSKSRFWECSRLYSWS